MTEIDLNKYSEFVHDMTSEASLDLTTLINRLDVIDGNYDFATHTHGPDVSVPLMLTGVMGLCSESGELMEIVKKIVFQGKPLTAENHFHMTRELGDIMFYWINMCRALCVDPNEVIAGNMEKLSKRYPNGFNIEKSETRDKGDV